MVTFIELDRAAAEDGARIAAEDAQIAHDVDLQAEPAAAKATGPAWNAIIEAAAD